MVATGTAWTSPEIAKLAVSALTPLLLFVLGLVVARAGRRVEQAQWANRKLIERRLELHTELAPKLNDVLCFFQCVGHFRAITPPDVLELKRSLDKIFFANEQLFSRDFVESYGKFMKTCFGRFGATGAHSMIKASLTRIKAERGSAASWAEEWDDMFDSSVEDLGLFRIEGVAEA